MHTFAEHVHFLRYSIALAQTHTENKYSVLHFLEILF